MFNAGQSGEADQPGFARGDAEKTAACLGGERSWRVRGAQFPHALAGSGKSIVQRFVVIFSSGTAIDDCRGKMLFAAEQCPSLFELHTQF